MDPNQQPPQQPQQGQPQQYPQQQQQQQQYPQHGQQQQGQYLGSGYLNVNANAFVPGQGFGGAPGGGYYYQPQQQQQDYFQGGGYNNRRYNNNNQGYYQPQQQQPQQPGYYNNNRNYSNQGYGGQYQQQQQQQQYGRGNYHQGGYNNNQGYSAQQQYQQQQQYPPVGTASAQAVSPAVAAPVSSTPAAATTTNAAVPASASASAAAQPAAAAPQKARVLVISSSSDKKPAAAPAAAAAATAAPAAKKDAAPTVKTSAPSSAAGSPAASPAPSPAPVVAPASAADSPAPAPAAAAATATPEPAKPVFSKDREDILADEEDKPAETASKEEKKETPAEAASAAEKSEPAAAAAAAAVQEKDDEPDPNVKEHLNIVFIGHVDAGKSTIGGHLLYLTGMVDKRTLEKYEREAKEQNRESWFLSWALDTNPEERAKGKTVEYGRAHFETEKRRFTIIDAPGHKNYVPSMIGGAAQADIAILVISARKGEYEAGFDGGGQTREHALLAKTAGVQHLVVVINKMDDPTVMWAQERYDECVGALTKFLRTVGYNPSKGVQFMPISGFNGSNLKDRLTKDVCPWYDGPSLIEFLDNIPLADRHVSGPLILPVTDKFRDMGTIVCGKIEAGKVRKGQNVLVMPNKRSAEVLAVYLEEEEVKSAVSGENVRLRLKGVEEEDLSLGFVICTASNPVHTVKSFEAEIQVLEPKNLFTAGYGAVLHVHTCTEEITISKLLHLVDPKTNKKSKTPPMFAKKGQRVIAVVECTGVICVEPFSENPQLGRFTLRDEGKTIAAGKITKLLDLADVDQIAAATAKVSL